MPVIAPIEDLRAVQKELLEVRDIGEMAKDRVGKYLKNSDLKKAYLKICNWKA